MDSPDQESLEKALSRTERDAEIALKAASAALSALRKFRTAAQMGDLRELRKAIEASDQAVSALKQQFTNAKEGWRFDESYLTTESYLSELIKTAQLNGMNIFEQDGRLYCYPFLVQVSPNEPAVLIDKSKERRLRPSVLVNHLKDLQSKPVRFKPEALLDALFEGYLLVIAQKGSHKAGMGSVVPLLDIYELLTLLPGQSKDYARQEFARDIYLLDRSGVTTTRKNYCVSFPASTGLKHHPSKIIRVVAEGGQQKEYYGIKFVSEGLGV